MEWTPEGIVRFSGSWWSVAAVHAAAQLDLFTPLADGSLAVEELASRLGCTSRGVGILVRALCALSLLETEEGRVKLTPFAAENLVSTSPAYVGSIIRHHASLMPRWCSLAEVVRTGIPVGPRPFLDDGDRSDFLKGMADNARLHAGEVMAAIDLAASRRLLDLGGGPGTYATTFCAAVEGMTAVVYDLPTTKPIAEESIAAAGMQERVSFAEGDILKDEVPGGFDTVWVSHVLHSLDMDGCRTLVRKAMASLEPEGRIFIQDFYLDDGGKDPLFAALFGLNMLTATEGGRTYEPAEIRALLEEAGAVNISFVRLPAEEGAGIVMAEKPEARAFAPQGGGFLAKLKAFFGMGGD